jgi:hypothetical protein
MELTGEEKEHIRNETKLIVTGSSFVENRARASRIKADEAAY